MLPLIAKHARAGEPVPGDYAMLYDRVQTRHLQRYASAFRRIACYSRSSIDAMRCGVPL